MKVVLGDKAELSNHEVGIVVGIIYCNDYDLITISTKDDILMCKDQEIIKIYKENLPHYLTKEEAKLQMMQRCNMTEKDWEAQRQAFE